MLSIETNASGNRAGECHNITTEFKLPTNLVNINGLIGIPGGAEVEIECRCLNPKKVCAEWTYNENNISTTASENEAYVSTEGPRATLSVDSFREGLSGLYTCHSRDKTEDFNLTWYDPGKWQ